MTTDKPGPGGKLIDRSGAEELVFRGDSWTDHDCERWPTWQAAEEGHEAVVEKWRQKINESTGTG